MRISLCIYIDEDITIVDTTPSISTQIARCDKQIHDEMQHNSKVKATIEDSTFILHIYYLMPFYLSLADQRELRTTLHQVREDDEHMDIPYMIFQRRAQFSWKELLSRIKKAHAQVNANLNIYYYVCDISMLSTSILSLGIRIVVEGG